MNTYEVELYEYGVKTVVAKSKSAAKYAAYLDYDVTGGLGFGEYLKWVKSVRLVHKFRAADLFGDVQCFERVKEARSIPFAYMGQKVVLRSNQRGDLSGVIVGVNHAMNLDVVFDGTFHKESCHPHYRLTYYNKNNEPIASF